MSKTDRVRRRRVLHITGYDGRPPEATLAFFRREIETWAQRFGRRAAMAAETDAAAGAPRWHIAFDGPPGGVSVSWTLLRWDDLVRQDQERGFLARAGLALATLAHVIRTGTFGRWRRASPLLARIFLAPYLICALVPGLAVLASSGALAFGAGPGPAVAAGGLAVAGLVLAILLVPGEPLFALQPLRETATIGRLAQLFDLWAFACSHAAQASPALSMRLDRFSEAIMAARRDSRGEPADEIVLIGHSLGAVLALEALDRTPASSPPLVLLTLGALHEALGSLPGGARIRAIMGRVAARDDVIWIDVADDQDPLSFPKGDGPERLGVARGPGGQPIFVDPDFGRTLSAETLRRSKLRVFRMHYRYLTANEDPDGWDIYGLLGGTRPVAEMIGGAVPRRSDRGARSEPDPEEVRISQEASKD